MPGSIEAISLWLIGVAKGRFLLMISYGTMAAILDLVSVDYLTNAWVDFFVAYWE
jgi:hypothetical protein